MTSLQLGFHYHCAVKVKNEKLYVPGYIGVFIDSLANNCKKLYLFCEEQNNEKSIEEDYQLLALNIEWINLGTKSTFYHRVLFPNKKVATISKYAQNLDVLLIRAPTPLAPFIWEKLYSQIPVYPLLVGNYIDGLKDLKQPYLRKLAIILVTRYYQYKQNLMISNSKIFVNSIKLKEQNEKIAKEITAIKTTTLDNTSFFYRTDTCLNSVIRVLYTGRINNQKGLRELVQAVGELKNLFSLEVHIIGWEDSGRSDYSDSLKVMAKELGIENRLFLHGKKNIGEELNAFYRSADIYVIPSYHEGFPRSIWEAMANSLPVVATKVGSIPYYLKHKEQAYLINPRSVTEIKDALTELICDVNLRKKIIKSAYEYAQEITLEKQTALLMDGIKNYMNNDRKKE